MELTPALLERCRPLLRLQVRRLQLDKRLHRRFDSSDMIQEALTRAIGRAEQFRGDSDAAAIRWLQRILKTVVLNKVEEAGAQARDYKRKVPIEGILNDSSARVESFLEAQSTSPSNRFDRAELLLRLAASIERLPDEQRDVVSLRDLHGYRVDEIAEMLGKSEKAVAGLVFRGRMALRRISEEIGLLPP